MNDPLPLLIFASQAGQPAAGQEDEGLDQEGLVEALLLQRRSLRAMLCPKHQGRAQTGNPNPDPAGQEISLQDFRLKKREGVTEMGTQPLKALRGYRASNRGPNRGSRGSNRGSKGSRKTPETLRG